MFEISLALNQTVIQLSNMKLAHLSETEMLNAAVKAIRAKFAVDAIKYRCTAETGDRFLKQMVAAGVPDGVARLVIMQALGQ